MFVIRLQNSIAWDRFYQAHGHELIFVKGKASPWRWRNIFCQCLLSVLFSGFAVDGTRRAVCFGKRF